MVSNNPQDEVVRILANSGLLDRFDVVAGNDGSGRAKKPAPDSYLTPPARSAWSRPGAPPSRTSVLGLRAARASGAYVIAVATGAELFETLKASRPGRRLLPAFHARCCVGRDKRSALRRHRAASSARVSAQRGYRLIAPYDFWLPGVSPRCRAFFHTAGCVALDGEGGFSP